MFSIQFKKIFAISIYPLRLSPALLYVPSVTAILDRRLTPWGQKCRIQKDINKLEISWQWGKMNCELAIVYRVWTQELTDVYISHLSHCTDLRWVVLQSILYSNHMVPSYQWYFIPLQINIIWKWLLWIIYQGNFIPTLCAPFSLWVQGFTVVNLYLDKNKTMWDWVVSYQHFWCSSNSPEVLFYQQPLCLITKLI